MATQYLPSVETETDQPVQASVLWLHGLGASGDDFLAVVPQLKLPTHMGVRFIFPDAPSIPVTVNRGFVMPAWYDILELTLERKLNMSHLLGSVAAIHALIDREIERGVRSDRIALAGFSQGGAVAYYAALTYPKPLAGLIALSTYFPNPETAQLHPANATLPVVIMHGEQDGAVPEILGQWAQQYLTECGYQPCSLRYPINHEVCYAELQDISHYLSEWFTA